MEIIPKRRKLAEVFKKAFPGINRGPVAPHKGLRLPVTIALATTAAATVCTITDLLKNRNIDLTSEELQQATTLATEFTGGLYQDVKPQLDQAGFVEPTFQVGVVKQDGQLNIQRYFAADNILFMVPVTDVNGKSGIILRNLSAPFDPLMSLNSARAVDLVTLYQSQNGADLIGISEEGEIVYKAVNAWVDGHINENATIEVMTADSTGIKDGGFAQLKIENPNSPSVVISAQINPDNPNEVLGQVDQENKRLSKVIPPTPEGLPISLISLSINPVTPTPKPTETPIPTATATPTEVPLPSEFLAKYPNGGYEIVDGKVMVNGEVWFEINSAGEWQDKRPLYWQCGPKIYPSGMVGETGVIEKEVDVLPTGLISKGEFKDLTYLKVVTARACLTELDDVLDLLFPEAAIRGKVVFFDLDGKAHEYNIMMGGDDNSGRWGAVLSIGTIIPDGVHYRFVPIKEALPILENYYNNSDNKASRQIDIDFATQDLGGPWILGEYINPNRELLVQLIEALKTGRGFPENVPEEFFLWIIQVQFMPGFTP